MEKFGIFELLDALSAITASIPKEQPEKASLSQSEPVGEEQARPKGDALASFLARHNAISNKIDGKR